MQGNTNLNERTNHKLIRAREEQALSQKELAEEIGVDVRTIRRWENEGYIPQASLQRKLMEHLHKPSPVELGFLPFFEEKFPQDSTISSALDSRTSPKQPIVGDSIPQQEQRDSQQSENHSQREETSIQSSFHSRPIPPPAQAFTSRTSDEIGDLSQVFSPPSSVELPAYSSLSSTLQESQIEAPPDELNELPSLYVQEDDSSLLLEGPTSVSLVSSQSLLQPSVQQTVPQSGIQSPKISRFLGRRYVVAGIITGTLLLCAGTGGAVWYSVSHQQRETVSPKTTPTLLVQNDLIVHTAPITSVIWSKTIVASGSMDGTVKAWDVSKVPPQVSATFGKPDSNRVVSSLALSPDGKRLATGLWSSEVNICEIAARSVTLSYTEHTSSVNTVAWSPTGAYIASGSSYPEGLVKVWNAATKELHYTVPPFKTKSGKIHNVSAVVWSADGSMIAVATLAGSVSFHDVRKKRPVFSSLNLPDSVNTLAWSPKSLQETQYLVVGCGDYDLGSLTGSPTDTKVYIVNIQTGQEQPYLFHEQAVLAVAWSSDGRYVASAGADQKVVVWEPFTGRVIAVNEYSRPIFSVAWSPDNTAIVSGGADKKIHIRQILTTSSS